MAEMKLKRESGAVMVEFALVVPLILLLVLGLIEFGVRFQRQAQLNNAAFVAARTVAVGNVSTAQSKGVTALPSGIIGSPGWGGIVTCTVGDDVTVTLTATINSPTGFFGGTTYPASATGVSRCGG